MGIRPEAWWNVAENNNEDRTGLSLEIARELRDRQRNSYAVTTFSEKVEIEMQKNGNTVEAEWCRLFRNFYRSVDEAGMDVSQGPQCWLEMRDKLLSYSKLGQFPPVGLYVADMPITQYEGIMCNIDRRIQMYAISSTGTYNQRSVSSLDSENIFGAFQVIALQYSNRYIMNYMLLVKYIC